MPYANLDEKREKQRIAYMIKYWTKRGFREAEARRKAEFYADNPEYQDAVKQRVYESRGRG